MNRMRLGALGGKRMARFASILETSALGFCTGDRVECETGT